MHRLLPATLLVSAGAIGYELALMRALSIVQWHHFAYMIISLALLGYGASGSLIALFKHRLEARFETAFAVSAFLCSVMMVLCFAVAQRVPFNALEIIWDGRQLGYLSLLYLLFFLPFLFAACCIGLAFTCRPREVGQIYFFDLLGAGIGAVLFIGASFILYPQDTLLALTALPLIASVIMGRLSAAKRPLVVAQLAWLALLLTGLPQSYLALRVSEYKGLSQALQVVDSRLVHTASSPLGLITVVDSPTVPVRHAPGLSFASPYMPPEQLAVFTDGDGMSALTRYDGSMSPLQYLGYVTAALPYELLDDPRVLVLGAGTGGDVLLALYHDAASIDAVELNPDMTALVRDVYRDFAGPLYADPRVRVHTREARGFVAQSDARYDVVQIGLLDSFGASGAGVQSLNESYIYTVEALRDYLRVTAPGGIVAITRWLKLPPRDNLKLAATAIGALRAEGVTDPGQQIAMIRSWSTVTLLIKNGALTPVDIEAIRTFAASRSFDTAWFPGIKASETNRFNLLDEPFFYQGLTALLGDAAEEYKERYKFDIEPATDDRPYYFHFFKWATLPELLALRQSGGAGLVEWGYLVLAATLAQAILAGVLLIMLPLIALKKTWPAAATARFGSYFLLLGLAFLFIEIAFIQKLILFLSHPLYSVAVVLSGFLVFAGVGSACSERLAQLSSARSRSPIALAVLCIAVLAAAYVFVLPLIIRQFIGFPDVARIAIAILLIMPLAFCMGLPFPLGLRRVGDAAPDFIPWAWGINGFASVISAVLATLLAIEFGFNAVIFFALLLYVAAAVVIGPTRLEVG